MLRFKTRLWDSVQQLKASPCLSTPWCQALSAAKPRSNGYRSWKGMQIKCRWNADEMQMNADECSLQMLSELKNRVLWVLSLLQLSGGEATLWPLFSLQLLPEPEIKVFSSHKFTQAHTSSHKFTLQNKLYIKPRKEKTKRQCDCNAQCFLLA